MGVFSDKTSMERILFAVFTYENKQQGDHHPAYGWWGMRLHTSTFYDPHLHHGDNFGVPTLPTNEAGSEAYVLSCILLY
jgi:hypothetical protein